MVYPEANTKKPFRFRNSHFAQISIFLVILFFAPGAEISNVIYKGIPYKLHWKFQVQEQKTKSQKISKSGQNENFGTYRFFLYSSQDTPYQFSAPHSNF